MSFGLQAVSIFGSILCLTAQLARVPNVQLLGQDAHGAREG